MRRTIGQSEVFEKMPISEAVRKMAVPAVIGQIVVLLYNLADTFYVGQTNNPYMVAGVSLILPVFNITLALAILVGMGGGAYISKLMGEARAEEAEKSNQFCIWVTTAVTGFFALLIFIFSRPLLFALGAGSDTYVYARQYMLITVVLGGIPTVLSSVLSYLLRSIGFSKEAGIGVALGGILNIFLDPLFMFVLLADGNEVLGVALATFLSNLISCGYCLYVMCKQQRTLLINAKLVIPRKESIISILAIGIPAAINVFLFDLDYMVLNSLMSNYGDFPLAALGIVLKVERFPTQVGIGLCQAMVPLIAYNLAAGNHVRMKAFITHFLRISIVVSICSIIIYEIFASQIISFFINQTEVVQYAVGFLRVRTIVTLFTVLSFFMVHVFQAMGREKTAVVLCIVRWVIFNISALLIFDRIMGMLGLIWAQFFADALAVVVSIVIYKKLLRKF